MSTRVIDPEIVCERLDNAVENGYEMQNKPAAEIAIELCVMCSDFDDIDDPRILLPAIIQWQFGIETLKHHE